MKPILQLCVDQCRIYERMISCMQAKSRKSAGGSHGAIGDSTSAGIERVRGMMKELDDLLEEHGQKRQKRFNT